MATLNVTPSWQAQFDALSAQNPVPAWLTTLRQEAFARFQEIGFPNRHNEEWRFTPVTPITETIFEAAQKAQDLKAVENALPELGTGSRLVFVNGIYSAELSHVAALPKGVVVTTLSEALQTFPEQIEPVLGKLATTENQAFVALNTAFAQEGAVVLLPRNAVVEDPIHLLYVSVAIETATVSYPRTLVVAEANSQATVTESYLGVGSGTTFTNAVTEIVLAENAVIDHYKLQQENLSAYHIALMQIALARSSNFSSHNLAIGGSLVRNEANAVLGGEGVECTLNGLYLANDRQLIDNHTAIDHALPHCNSHELYKGILNGNGRGVFNGKIFVREDAQKTDAKQTNQTLLLSKEAQINTKPQLEIFADDVRCTHGATVGQLSAEALFYLRSRGIGEEEARSLLTYAFASDIIDRVRVPELRDHIHRQLFGQLPTAIRPEEN
jgi:Fe-S cluster assembly protein SufD